MDLVFHGNFMGLPDASSASFEFWIQFTHISLHRRCIIYSHPLNISFYGKPTLNISIYSSLNFTDYLHGTCIYVFMNSPLEGQNTSPVSTASTQLAVRRSLIFTTSLVNGSLLKRWRQQCVNIDEAVRFKEKL